MIRNDLFSYFLLLRLKLAAGIRGTFRFTHMYAFIYSIRWLRSDRRY